MARSNRGGQMAPPPVKVGWEWTSVKEGLMVTLILKSNARASSNSTLSLRYILYDG